MLVLSRKVGEKIVIGSNITIVVQRVGKGRVALAIDAPQDISVLRAELAPFGVEDTQIEFIDAGGDDHDESLTGLAAPRTKALPRPAPGNNRLREEASSRTGFPLSAPSLNPTAEPGSVRMPHSLPSR